MTHPDPRHSPGRWRQDPLLTRSAWTFLGQVLSSGSNFVVGLVILAGATAPEYAAFSVVLTSYLLITQLNRSAISMPVLMLYSARDDPAVVSRHSGPAAAAAILVGILGSVALSLTALGFSTGRGQFLVLTVCLPLLQYQDLVRHVAFASAKPQLAAASDMLWLTLQAVGSLVVVGVDHASPTLLLAAWAVGGAASGIVFGIRLGVAPRFSGCRAWLATQGALCRRLFIEFLLNSGSFYALCYGLAVIAGTDQLGRLRAAQSLIGPVSVLLLGANALSVPESVRVRAQFEKLRRLALLLSISLVVAATVGGLMVYLLLPTLGPALFPRTWEAARPVLPMLTLYAGAVGATTGVVAALRAQGKVGWIVRARAWSGFLALAVGLPASALRGANGALSGLALSEIVLAVAAWKRIRPEPRDGRAPSHDAPDLTPPALA